MNKSLLGRVKGIFAQDTSHSMLPISWMNLKIVACGFVRSRTVSREADVHVTEMRMWKIRTGHVDVTMVSGPSQAVSVLLRPLTPSSMLKNIMSIRLDR